MLLDMYKYITIKLGQDLGHTEVHYVQEVYKMGHYFLNRLLDFPHIEENISDSGLIMIRVISDSNKF